MAASYFWIHRFRLPRSGEKRGRQEELFFMAIGSVFWPGHTNNWRLFCGPGFSLGRWHGNKSRAAAFCAHSSAFWAGAPAFKTVGRQPTGLFFQSPVPIAVTTAGGSLFPIDQR